ncbi:MAG TPA: hypothetical protein VFQ92_00165 [Blastocatellia bacterium]|nr:hypothetical protein [Blastocatellia bacterium]
MQPDYKHESIRRYLLGMAAEDEREQIEERLLIASDYFEELLIAEDELIDQYVKGELSSQDKERFKTHFLIAPERRQKLIFAMALHRHIDTQSSDAEDAAPVREPRKQFIPTALLAQSPILKYSVTAALLLIIGSIFLLVMKSWQSSNGTSEPHAVIATLRPGTVRDAGETQRIVIPANAATVELKLELGADDYQYYRAAIETDEGNEVFTAEQLHAESEGDDRFVVVNVPARSLTAGDYQIELSGSTAGNQLEPINRYFFRARPH